MIDKLRQLKEESHMTNQQIAEKSNVPESTVARIISGKTPNPTITTVASMARAMGGSAADIFEEAEEKTRNNAEASEKDESTDVGTTEKNDPTDRNAASNRGGCPVEDECYPKKYHEDVVDLYRSAIRKKDAWIKRLFWCLVFIMLFISLVLVFDILHPSLGYITY